MRVVQKSPFVIGDLKTTKATLLAFWHHVAPTAPPDSLTRQTTRLVTPWAVYFSGQNAVQSQTLSRSLVVLKKLGYTAVVLGTTSTAQRHYRVTSEEGGQ